MTSVSVSQLTLDFEPSLADRHTTLRDFIAHRVTVHIKPQKTIAADMDLAPSMLSRKLNPGDGDTQRFNLDDLESYLRSTGDVAAVIEYLAAKYMQGDEQRRARTLARVELLANDLESALRGLRDAA